MALIFDLCAVVLILICAFIGRKRGFVGSLFVAASTVLSIPLSAFILRRFDFDNSAKMVIVFVLLIFIIKILFYALGRVLNIVKIIPIIKSFNAFLGLVFGVLNGIVITVIICSVMAVCFVFYENSLLDTILHNSYICRMLLSTFSIF